MQFEKGHLYHIFNQGNNKQKIFFERENYLFFLRKVRIYVLPFADILAWCLMQNHFHLMVKVIRLELFLDSEGFARSEAFAGAKVRSFNHSIGIMLRSYTSAINKQYERSGALFRQLTKAECLTSESGITPSFYNTKSGTKIHIDHPEFQYPQICFNYIHDNPVVAGLVDRATDWEFSSAREYAGLRDGKLINKEVATEYVDF